LLGAGDEALIEFPTYEILPNLARFTGATVTRFSRLPEEDWALDPDRIARLMTQKTKLVMLTNLHNPSSTLTDESALVEIGKIAARYHAHVLVDEVFLDCAWDQPRRSAFDLGPFDRFVRQYPVPSV